MQYLAFVHTENTMKSVHFASSNDLTNPDTWVMLWVAGDAAGTDAHFFDKLAPSKQELKQQCIQSFNAVPTTLVNMINPRLRIFSHKLVMAVLIGVFGVVFTIFATVYMTSLYTNTRAMHAPPLRLRFYLTQCIVWMVSLKSIRPQKRQLVLCCSCS